MVVSTPPFVDVPAGVAAGRWPVRGAQRAVLHAGLAGATDWAVLVPGFTGSKEDFIAVLPLLADAGIGAVAFDQLGQFESDGSPDAADYSLSLLGADVAAVARCAVEQAGAIGAPRLVGHSFGGLVAAQSVIDGSLQPSSLVLLCTGPGALPALEAVFTRKNGPSAWQPNRLVFGHIVEGTRVVDEAMAVYMAAPRSYTREDVCEIHVHGGRFAAEKTLQMVLRQGVRAAEPGEFTVPLTLRDETPAHEAAHTSLRISVAADATIWDGLGLPEAARLAYPLAALEEERARELVRSRLKRLHGLDRAVQVRRLAGLLARKGYPSGMASKIIFDEIDQTAEHARD